MRRDDWFTQLSRAVNDGKAKVFSWGRHDCCTFVARCLDAMCDSDYARSLAQCYADETSAKAFIASYGGIEQAVSSFLGPSLDAPPLAGDVCLVPTLDGDGVGISLGASVAVAGNGVELYPLSIVKRIWRPWAKQ